MVLDHSPAAGIRIGKQCEIRHTVAALSHPEWSLFILFVCKRGHHVPERTARHGFLYVHPLCLQGQREYQEQQEREFFHRPSFC